jgi:hypothetical protein
MLYPSKKVCTNFLLFPQRKFYLKSHFINHHQSPPPPSRLKTAPDEVFLNIKYNSKWLMIQALGKNRLIYSTSFRTGTYGTACTGTCA